MKEYKTPAEYIKSIPKSLLPHFTELRSLIKAQIPKGAEVIRYGIPTIQINGKNLVHFAAMKGHIGFYPTSSGVQAFVSELEKQHISFSKGCIRFPYNTPIPTKLVIQILKFRLKEEKQKVA